MHRASKLYSPPFSKLAVVALVSVLMTGCSKTDDPKALLSQARQFQQKGDTKAAVIQLKNALQKNPDDPEARFTLGSIYLDTGDALSAEKELRKAVTLGVKAERVVPLLGKALFVQGKPQQALDETVSVTGLSESAEILAVRGNALAALAKPDLAKAAFQKALDAKPDFAPALIGAAKLAVITHDLVLATRYADRATAKNPGDADAWMFKGDLLRTRGDAEGAERAYGEAVKLRPTDISILNSRANAYISSGKFALARTDLETAKKRTPGSLNLVYTQAVLDFSEGKSKAALDSLQLLMQSAPDYLPAILLSGAVQFSLGSNEQAEQNVKKYLAAEPDNLNARKLLASIYVNSGQTDAAMTVLGPALKTSPQDPQLLFIAGQSSLQGKDFTKAKVYFEKAHSLSTSTAASQTSSGKSDLDGAFRDDKSANAATSLVMSQLRLKQYDKALASVSALEKEQPGNPFVHNLKGGIHLALNDVPAARVSFEKAVSLTPTYFPAIDNLARLDLQDKHPDAAKKRFEALLAKDQRNVPAMTALANLATATGQPHEATAWLIKAAAVDPDAVGPQIDLGRHYLKTGDKEMALALAKKLIATNDSNPAVIDFMGQSQAANNELPGALLNFKKLTALQPGSAAAQVRVAAIELALQNSAGAIASLDKALLLQPDNIEAQVLLFSAQGKAGNYDAALKIARQVQLQRPKDPAGFLMDGDVMSAQKKFLPAQKSYEQALALGGTDLSLVKLHGAMIAAGKEKEAYARLAQWLADHPDNVTVRLYMGDRHLARGQHKAAIAQYENAMKVSPHNPAVLNNLAYAYLLTKDSRALETAEAAFKLAPANTGVMDTLGWALVEKGNDARGLALLQKASAQVPSNEEIRFHLAVGLMKAGDKARARKELTQLSASKTFPRVEEAKRLLKEL